MERTENVKKAIALLKRDGCKPEMVGLHQEFNSPIAKTYRERAFGVYANYRWGRLSVFSKWTLRKHGWTKLIYDEFIRWYDEPVYDEFGWSQRHNQLKAALLGREPSMDNLSKEQKLEELYRTPIHLTISAGALNLLLQYLSFCVECNPLIVPSGSFGRAFYADRERPLREPLYYGDLNDLIHLVDNWYTDMQRQLAAAGGNLEALRTGFRVQPSSKIRQS